MDPTAYQLAAARTLPTPEVLTARLTCRYGDCNEPATGGDQLQIDGGRMLTVNYCERHGKLWNTLPDIVNNGAGKCVMSGCGASIFAVHCCRRHYDQTKPWKMATALRFSATMPEVPMSVASYPPPDDLPVAPPPTPEVPDAVAPTPPALEAAKAPQGDAGDPTPAGQPSFYAGSVPVYVGGVTAPEPLKFIGPAAPAPTMAELQEQIRTLQAQLAENVSNAKYVCDAALSGLRIVAESGPLARVAELEAERDYERKRANEALSQLHDVKEAMKAGDEGYRMVERENREACHLLMLLGIKVGTLPDMIAALLPRSRLLKLRIRNETAAALAIDNLSLQEVAEDDPRMAAAIARHREATALRRAAEPDHSPDAGNMVQG